jgi:aspartokinase/homoserine dehydrogenase 1
MMNSLLRLALGLVLALSTVEAFHPLVSTQSILVSRKNSIRVALSAATLKEDHQAVNAATGTSSITKPRGSKNAWEVHKFGGASLATADLYRTVGDLLIEEAAGRGDGRIPTMAVVSARGGMTDLLVEVVETAIVDFDKAKSVLEEAIESQITLLKELAPPEITDKIEARFRQDAQDVASVVQSLRMIHTVPAVTMEVVTGFGEIWSAQTLYAYLQTKDVPCGWLDARDILIVKGDSLGLGEKGAASTGGVLPLWHETESRIEKWWNTIGRERGFLDIDYSTSSPILVVTGFVATTGEGVPTTLKRSGSDYSATIFAKLIEAGRVTMWKNTDGVYTADPRRVPEAFPIKSLKYDEAMELAYFGAQVLHPSAMVPCIDNNIPVYVRNIFNPAFEGTVIRGRSATLKDTMNKQSVKNWRANRGEIPIKGITSVDKIALVTLEGASIGGALAAERFMGAMADNGINVLIITQASSESSITVAVPENEGRAALLALQDAFELELSRSTVNSVSLATGMAIVAIVGEGMALKSGVSSTFMSSMARANVNIRLIAQGSSERQIAVVVDGNDTSRALRAAHMAFTLSETTASVAVLGSTGSIGSALCRQLKEQKEKLAKDLGVAMSVNIAACSTKMILGQDSRGLDPDDFPKLLSSDKACECDLDLITTAIEADVNPLRVIVDCTNSEQVAEYYERWIDAGVNIIGPSRKVPAGDLDRYHRVHDSEREKSVSWLFESSVGSALPVLTTLRDLIETGDNVKLIRGCVSGTMAYVLSKTSETMSFSEAARSAYEKGFTENDMREDLSGFDMAQKVVILARQLGLEVNIEDVEVESLIPQDIIDKEYPGDKDAVANAVLEDIKQGVDESMLERLKAAEAEGMNLRYKFVIDAASGKCKCSLEAVDQTDPLFRLKKDENLVAFETSRYATSPLIVKGAAAGPDLAASGIFADLLRLTRAYSALQ